MNRENQPQRKPLLGRKALWYALPVLAITIIAILVIVLIPREKAPDPISLSNIAAAIMEGKVEKVEDSSITGDLTIYFNDDTVAKGVRDSSSPLLEQLLFLGVTKDQIGKFELVHVKGAAATGGVAGLILVFGVVGAAVFVAARSNRGERWGKKSYEETQIPSICFADVAGLKENVQELRDVVTFLKDGDKYAELGAKMPRGVLMVGDPGTGKTLIAKAVAGEAGVPFFATSGSEFTEVFVGVGAGRIRALFKKAKKVAPCIIFIDEIDAVGRSRHKGESGAEMEQDQTLNQLLVEMDGFGTSEGVIVLAATNRDDVLDPALTRPGRFDRRVFINRPDIKGREEILGIHTRGKKLSIEVSLENIARATPGLVGADLANIVNEAAISAVRSGHTSIMMSDFEEAIEKHITGGVQRGSQVMSQDEREIVAFHEAGHAVVMHETQMSDPVYKITIIPRGKAGGYTIALPEKDINLISRCKIISRITGLLGGRAAEEIFFHDVTSGASNDLSVATQLAEDMVIRLGMHPTTGLRVYPQYQSHSVFSSMNSSQKTFENIDEAVKEILDTCYADAKKILTSKRSVIERVAGKLLECETIDRELFLQLTDET